MDYDQAILKALYSNEVLTHNKLFTETRKNRKYSSRTFEKYLKILVKDGDVIKKSTEGQEIEYFINQESLIIHILKLLDKSVESIIHVQQKFEKILKKESKVNIDFESLVRKKYYIFERSTRMITSSMKISVLCSLLLSTPLSSKTQQKEITKIRSENENNIRKLYQIFQKIDPKASLYLFNLVKRDVYSNLDLND